MNAVLAIAIKDIRLLLRDRMGFFFSFFFPLLIAVFFGVVFRGGGGGGGAGSGIPVAVVDLDNTAESAAFAAKLIAASELEVTTGLSPTEAEEAVRIGRLRGSIVLLPGFGEARRRPFWGEPMSIELAVDPSRAALASMLEGVVTRHAFEGLSEMFADPAKMRGQVRESMDQMRRDGSLPRAMRPAFEMFFNALDSMLQTVQEDSAGEPGEAADPAQAAARAGGWQPVRVSTRAVTARPSGLPTNSFALTFPQGVIWGMMGCALGFAITLVMERTRGTLLRLRIAPLSRMQILAGKAVGCFMVTASVAAMLMVIARVVFQVQPTSVIMLAAAIACSSACFVGIMMLLAAVSRTEAAGNGLGWGVLLLMAMIGGGMVPLEFMPGFIRTLSVVSPIRWSLLALEGGVFRGFSMAQMAAPCGVLLGIGAMSFAVGARLFRPD
ncbi:MAG: ABC transporter permease [Phycisphaeraceae bacterium]|nr:ABC transporter permease [Phycisphaeraceae bacterium]